MRMYRALTDMLRDLAADQRGVAAVEYGLIVSLVSVAAIPAFSSLGGSIGDLMEAVTGAIDGAVDGLEGS